MILSWLIGIIPLGLTHWIMYGALVVGLIATLAGFFMSAIPFISKVPVIGQYKLLIQIAGVVLLCLGVYLSGAYETEKLWRGKVADLQEKVRIAESKAPIINTVIEKQIVEKIKLVTDVKHVIHDVIVTQEKIINGECIIPPAAISVHNDSAKNRLPSVPK